MIQTPTPILNSMTQPFHQSQDHSDPPIPTDPIDEIEYLSSASEPDFICQLLVPVFKKSSSVTPALGPEQEEVDELQDDEEEIKPLDDSDTRTDRQEVKIHQVLEQRGDVNQRDDQSPETIEEEINCNTQDTGRPQSFTFQENEDEIIHSCGVGNGLDQSHNMKDETSNCIAQDSSQPQLALGGKKTIIDHDELNGEINSVDQNSKNIGETSNRTGSGTQDSSQPKLITSRQPKKRRKTAKKKKIVCVVSSEEEEEENDLSDPALTQNPDTTCHASPAPSSSHHQPKRRRTSNINPLAPSITSKSTHHHSLNVNHLNFQQTLSLLEQVDSGVFLLNQFS